MNGFIKLAVVGMFLAFEQSAYISIDRYFGCHNGHKAVDRSCNLDKKTKCMIEEIFMKLLFALAHGQKLLN